MFEYLVGNYMIGGWPNSLFLNRAVDPHSFYADPDPAVFLNADPDPGPGPA